MRPLLLLTLLFLPLLMKGQGFHQPDFFRKKRQLPFIELKDRKVLPLSKFGAHPNDGEDDLKAFRKAFAKAASMADAGKNIEILFEKGIYDLWGKSDGTHALTLFRNKNLLINGNGATIIMHSPMLGFLKMMNVKNVIIKDLYIDYDPLPFTQGKIIALNPESNTFDLQIDEGFPELSAPYFTASAERWGMLMDNNIPGKLKDGVGHLYPYKGWEKIGERTYRIQQPQQRFIDDMEVGDVFVQIARNNGKTIFTSFGGENLTFMNITSYASPAGTYAAFGHKEWNILNCNVRLKKGRYHSANADCIHVSGSMFGPWVEDCLFEGASDDAVNLKAVKKYILEQPQKNQILTVGNGVLKGDVFRFYNPREGVLLDEAYVINIERQKEKNFLITFNKEIQGLRSFGSDKRNDIAYIDTQACESFIFRNNTFRNARRFGMLLQSNYGIIENNTFENLSQCAISMNNGADWGEGFVAHDVLIKNNLFKNIGYDKTFLSQYNAASIRMWVTKLKNPEAKGKWCGIAATKWQGLNTIAIEGNHFIYNKRALSIECAQNIFINKNTFIRNPNDPFSEELDPVFQDNVSNVLSE
ncbi:right-handed parallel beta-helix repeat-containing protein [Flammeovirga sp. EKP202]|uniref:right-handed parallel beta-helix repeat-containing protein n=1 Tax=Flammeovirga sp. EKP202 TaxID=2770592 RepID=UPI00165F2AE3|nr:right-handed parallel beta-helix repeat-containing protein [Flammeovirga sp. EKP202]MBD0404314.1 right-handed parallel beta-helix repeat-containing protein [Flammeovirga sp. EKP202]